MLAILHSCTKINSKHVYNVINCIRALNGRFTVDVLLQYVYDS